MTPFQSIYRSILAGAFVAALLVIGAPDAYAQEEAPEPTRFENVDWHSVEMLRFKPGQQGRAMEIIDDHFIPTSQKAGTNLPVMIELQSGEWDVMMVWPMKDGPSAMEWEISPDGIKWRTAPNEAMGGAEKADALWQEYMSLIDDAPSYIGFSGRRGMKLTASQ